MSEIGKALAALAGVAASGVTWLVLWAAGTVAAVVTIVVFAALGCWLITRTGR